MKKKSVRKENIILGLVIGLSIGVLALAGILLLARPWRLAAPAAQIPSPTITPAPSVVATGVPSVTPEPLPSPTATIEPPEVTTHTVQPGDELLQIAIDHNTTVEAIVDASGLISPDLIYPGDVLTIPLNTVTQVAQESTPSPEGETPVESSMPESDAQVWQPSILEGDLEAAYPSTVETDRFTLHYQPNSLPAQNRDTIVGMVETSLTHIESTLDVNLEGHFDVYVAGYLFAPPDLALRGRSFSSQRRFFFLYDGTGTPADRQYIATHEHTHTTTWNTMGRPASVMLHEGVAVYVGMKLAEGQDSRYLSIKEFCAAYHQIGQLPHVSGSPSFQGHIRDLDTYYAAGCFVQYLIEEYGTDKFAEVYHTGDYYSVYGQGLTGLEAEWIATIESSDYSLSFNPDDLAYYVTKVAEAYDRLFANFTGTIAQMSAYRELDRARMALLQGHLADVATRLITFDELLAEQ